MRTWIHKEKLLSVWCCLTDCHCVLHASEYNKVKDEWFTFALCRPQQRVLFVRFVSTTSPLSSTSTSSLSVDGNLSLHFSHVFRAMWMQNGRTSHAAMAHRDGVGSIPITLIKTVNGESTSKHLITHFVQRCGAWQTMCEICQSIQIRMANWAPMGDKMMRCFGGALWIEINIYLDYKMVTQPVCVCVLYWVFGVRESKTFTLNGKLNKCTRNEMKNWIIDVASKGTEERYGVQEMKSERKREKEIMAWQSRIVCAPGCSINPLITANIFRQFDSFETQSISPATEPSKPLIFHQFNEPKVLLAHHLVRLQVCLGLHTANGVAFEFSKGKTKRFCGNKCHTHVYDTESVTATANLLLSRREKNINYNCWLSCHRYRRVTFSHDTEQFARARPQHIGRTRIDEVTRVKRKCHTISIIIIINLSLSLTAVAVGGGGGRL